MKERKPKQPKPIYGVSILDFRYSYAVTPPPKRISPLMPQPKIPKIPKPAKLIYVWVMKYRSPAPDNELQKDELKNAVFGQFSLAGHVVKSMKYIKSTNPVVYLQVKTHQGTQLVEITRYK